MIRFTRQFFRDVSSLLLLALLLSSCFGGVAKTGKVTGYRDGHVTTKKGQYRVGVLPEPWYRVDLEQASIAFRHDQDRSTISTDSFCDRAYNDSPLQGLTEHLLPGLQKVEIKQKEEFKLNGRGALRTVVSANLDGLPVIADLVVVKKDWCLFDFFLVSPPEKYEQALPDFKKFYQGFFYRGEE